MFHPGETVVHYFIIPFAVDAISEILISYKQDDHIILERKVTSAMLDSNTQGADSALVEYDDPTKTKFKIQFTQQESLAFTDHLDYTIQLNVYTMGHSRHASCEIKGSSGVQYDRKVMPHG